MSGDIEKTKAEPIAELDASREGVEASNAEQAQRALYESEERYRIVTEISRDVIVAVNDAGVVIFMNPAIEAVLGYTVEEMVGTSYESTFGLIHLDDRERVNAEFQTLKQVGDTAHYAPWRCLHKSGRWVWFNSVGTFYRSANGERLMLEVSQDITEQVEANQHEQKLAEEMVEAQRLESLGVLAGGIAHDFNNLLTPMLGDASLALLDLPKDSPARVRIGRIQKAAHRAAALISQMLAYAGKKPPVVEPLDVSKLVKELAQLLEGAVSGRAELIYELSEDIPMVEADAAQISQVVINLITNATEAVPERAGRTLLRTGVVESDRVDKQFLFGGDVLRSGSYVFIEVIDNGCGMDEEVQSKIFDPFYTTKFTGRGLGLAAALGIVRSHGGAIELDSEVGRGTRFRVLIPSAGRQRLSAASEEDSIEDWRGVGTVLVADDDEGVRELAGETLERAGLSVLLAKDGHEAIEIFQRQADEIKVVVLDRTMPNIGGEDAFDRIREIRSDARIILISGYSEERAAWHFIDRGLDAFLHKPFEPMALVETVRRILETGEG